MPPDPRVVAIIVTPAAESIPMNPIEQPRCKPLYAAMLRALTLQDMAKNAKGGTQPWSRQLGTELQDGLMALSSTHHQPIYEIVGLLNRRQPDVT